jgi:hypothetical protein
MSDGLLFHCLHFFLFLCRMRKLLNQKIKKLELLTKQLVKHIFEKSAFAQLNCSGMNESRRHIEIVIECTRGKEIIFLKLMI